MPQKSWTGAVHLRAGNMLVLSNGEHVVVKKIEQELQKLMHKTEQRSVRKKRLIAFIKALSKQAFVLGEWSEEAWVRMTDRTYYCAEYCHVCCMPFFE